MLKVKYTCKNCGWSTSLPAQWADQKPRRCMNKKCNTSFRKHPDKLDIDNPLLEQIKKEKEERKKLAQEKAKKNASSKSSRKSSAPKQQQAEEESSDERQNQEE